MAHEGRHLTLQELEERVEYIARSPKDQGTLQMIVRRPALGVREVLDVGELDVAVGLIGDTWRDRRSSRTADGSPHPDMQLTIMNVRAIDVIATTKARWPLAGDQLFIELDLTYENLPPSTRLQLGDAIIEITAQPHTGCEKFVERFGLEAMRFVNSALGRRYNVRGVNARVLRGGTIRVGDIARRLEGHRNQSVSSNPCTRRLTFER